MAVGGAEDKQGECLVLKEFVRLAKGGRARVVVMTVATDRVREVGAEYRAVFKRLGVEDVKVVDVSTRDEAREQKHIEAVEQATGVYFTGGDQLHITSLLGGTPLAAALRRRHEAGVMLGGTSAGAAMMSNSMFVSGKSNSAPRFGCVEMAPGMDFIVGAAIDTHFSQRGRIGRLITAVAHYPQDLGLGIDENTAMIVDGTTFEVVGEGAVTVVDAGGMAFSTLPYARRGDPLTLHDLKIHVISHGFKFDLANRQPIPEAKEKVEEYAEGAEKAAKPKEDEGEG